MPTRRTPQTLSERVAAVEEELRRRAADTATRPVVTDYTSLEGVPDDLATLADVAVVNARAADAEMLGWLGLGSAE